MKVFFDTNILIYLIQNEVELPLNNEYFTFEKCIYEIKNGIKRKLVNKEFIINALKDNKEDKKLKNEDLFVHNILNNVISSLNLTKFQLTEFIKLIKKVNLKYEFGIASENFSLDFNFNGVIDMNIIESPETKIKLFYKIAKENIVQFNNKLEKKLDNYGIKIILYDEIFSNKELMLEFRGFLEETFIPSSDLEIVFSAISNFCKRFLTTDESLVKDCNTLGLNHVTKFIYIEPNNLINLENII